VLGAQTGSAYNLPGYSKYFMTLQSLVA